MACGGFTCKGSYNTWTHAMEVYFFKTNIMDQNIILCQKIWSHRIYTQSIIKLGYSIFFESKIPRISVCNSHRNLDSSSLAWNRFKYSLYTKTTYIIPLVSAKLLAAFFSSSLRLSNFSKLFWVGFSFANCLNNILCHLGAKLNLYP